jgi:hypothetical protein
MKPILLLILSVFVAGCVAEPLPRVPGLEPLVSRGARVYVTEEPGSSPDRRILTVRLDSKSLNLNSYQGQLRFDPGSMEIIETDAPKLDGYRVVNINSAKDGTIRFAGFTAGTFSQDVVVWLSVKPLRDLGSAHLVASLDVAGEGIGSPIQPNELIRQAGVFRMGPP